MTRARWQSLELVLSEHRVVVAGPADRRLTGHLAAVCGPRFLQVAPAEVATNNAEVLLVPGRAGRQLARYRSYRHARYVAVNGRGLLLALPALVRHLLRGRLAFRGRSRLVRRTPAWWLFEVTAPSRQTARRYVSPALGFGGFLAEMGERDVRYAVLRWYELLPDLPAGEDLDLLVDDEHLAAVEALLAERPGTLPCDVYTVSGLPGTDYHAMAYFPPRLARRLLDRAVTAGGVRVPCAADAFDSLAYHAVHQKGHKSGLPVALGAEPLVATPEHDYADALRTKAEAAGVRARLTLEDLTALLAQRDWAPPLDTLARLGQVNPWAADMHERAAATETGACAGLAVFFVRAAATSAEVAVIRARLVGEGFALLACSRLDHEAQVRIGDGARGGNWGRGPFPRSGGAPAYVVAAVDVMPQRPSARILKAWPRVDNERLLVKEGIRDEINERRAEDHRCNVVHSSDNAAEAAAYLRLALPASAAALMDSARRLSAGFEPDPELVRDLTRHGRRARVELVRSGQVPAVRKTFRPGCERFLARERTAMAELARGCPHLLPLLAEGPSWVAMPYVENSLRFDARHPRLLPLDVARAALDTARYVHSCGYALVDFTPANLLVDASGHTYVVDYEFLHRYAGPAPALEDSYDLSGPPRDFVDDLPVNPRGLGWAAAWEPYVGVSLRTMLQGSRRRQHAARTRHRLTVLWPDALRRSIARQGRRIRRRLLHWRRSDVRNQGVRASVS